MFLSRLVRVALALVAIGPLSAAGILTVGPPGSGAQFTQIQAAVNAALDDDVILVQPGTYQRIVVDKPLRILGVAPGVVIDAGFDNSAVIVRGIAAAKEFVLSGVSARSLRFLARLPAIQLENSPGTLALQDVVIRYDPRDSNATIGVQLENCARVLLLDSRILEAGIVEVQTGALVARNSELWIANSEIRGTHDGFFALSGSHGIEATDSTLRVWRS